MVKQAPSVGRIVAMVVFTLSCFGLLMFLWLAFGGPIPIKPEGYRLKVRFPEAATLAVEADVRIAGVNVGKVKKKTLDKRGARTVAELQLKSQYAPMAKDTRAILRQKTLLGETYVELAPGHRSTGMLDDGGYLPNSSVEDTVELEEILSSFDTPTRNAFKQWMKELALAVEGGRGQDLNDALGNLEPFAVDGTTLLKVLDEQEIATRRLVRNTGEVFEAINERDGALGQLIVNANNTFEATASRDEALRQTFEIFPTFLDESRVTLARLERFARNTHPLINDLKRPADDIGPTVRDLGDLAPDLENLFLDLPALIRASRRGLPDLERILRGSQPLVEAAHTFFPELNPILSYLNFHQTTVAGFLMNGAGNLSGKLAGRRYQTQVGILSPTSLAPPIGRTGVRTRQDWERGNAYMAPNALQRGIALGTIESFDCKPSGVQRNPADHTENPNPLTKAEEKRPPCFVQPPSLWNGKQFVAPGKGESPVVDAPSFREGRSPAVDPNPGNPLF